MMPFDTFRSLASLIPYQYRHPEFLYSMIRWLRPENVTEVGTHLGMSAVWMGRALQENDSGHLWCIDNFCWKQEPNQESDWFTNIDRCGVMDRVTLIKGRSQEVCWPKRVDFAYIDGNHTFDVCYHDVVRAMRLGATCICLNDTATCEGVQRVVGLLRDKVFPSWDVLEVNFDAGLLVALKHQPRPNPTQGDYDQWDKQEQRKQDWQPPPNFQGE